MSSRDTFVTSYIYDDDTKDAVKAVLSEYAFAIQDHGHYLSGFIKNSFTKSCYWDFWEELEQAVKSTGYDMYFDIAVIRDDQKCVCQRDDEWGDAAQWVQIKERNLAYVNSVREQERAKVKQ